MGSIGLKFSQLNMLGWLEQIEKPNPIWSMYTPSFSYDILFILTIKCCYYRKRSYYSRDFSNSLLTVIKYFFMNIRESNIK